MQIRQDLLAELPEGDRLRAHVYAAMGDALDRGEGKIAEEAACYEKSLEIVPNLYSLKNLATLYFRYPELGKPKELAFEIWEKAWHAGVWSAANFLGYNYQEEAWLDLPKAIEWLEKGMLYCELYSAYELALIYLYNDDYKNVERGLVFLVLVIFANIFAGNQKDELINRKSAIVFAPTVTVKSSPDASGTDLFILHEGTKVSIKSKLGDWNEIEMEDGNVGWMPSKDMEII